MSNRKTLERNAASILDGKRNSRGMDFSISIPNVEEPRWMIECKYSEKIGFILNDGLRLAEMYYPETIPVLCIARNI